MSGKPRVATVFGGAGFIGRYIVQRLAARDYMVRVAVRNVPGALFLQTMGGTGQIVPLYAPLGAEALVARATEGAELVVNATGLLSENRKGDFHPVHVEGAGQVARLAASSGARQVVHLSAIGADAASPSAYGRSKAAGEAAVRSAFPSRGDPAPFHRVRRRGQFFQPFCCHGLVPPGAAHCRRRHEIPAGLCRRCRRRRPGGAIKAGGRENL